jgi:antibiotic biosynthesis monooxygenase (ABM) superfamily enzyme
MPGAETPLQGITHAIQLAIAPVFLLAAVGAIINALMGRLARAVDRRRVVEDLVEKAEDERREKFLDELKVLSRRTVLTLWAIGLAVLCALLVCLLIFVAFLGAFLVVDLSRTVAILFIAAVASLTVCMLIFMREVIVAATSAHQSVWLRPRRARRKATAEAK